MGKSCWRAITALVISLVISSFVISGIAAAADPTLDVVKQRGQLVCGVNGSVPGFSLLNAVKEWEGLDVDICRGVAAAVLGKADRVKFVALSTQQRFEALRSGEVDVLAANSTITLQRTAGIGLEFTTPNYYDGQGFVVPKKLGIAGATALASRDICALRGTTHEDNMKAWFGERRLKATPMMFDNQEAMYEAFFAGRCVAVTQDATALAATVVRSGKAADYMMLPEIISREPLGPYVRRGNDAWADIVRWTQYAMLEAEALGVTRDKVSEYLRSNDPRVQRLLGITPGAGKALGLDETWAYNIVAQVGNYGESYERNVGKGSALKFARGINALWSQGGLMYPMPFR
jgi:general L-amino acid transport system substrate-binding protein